MSRFRGGGGSKSTGGAGPRGTAPRLLPGEREDLLIHVLRCRPVLREARDRLKPSHFNTGVEEHFRVTLSLFYSLAERQYPDGDVPYRALYNEVARWVEQAPDNPELRAELLATPDDVAHAEAERVGFIWHVYNGVEERHLDARMGLDLLKRFLMEREAYDQATLLLETGKGGPGADFAASMLTVTRSAQMIDTIAAAPSRAIGEEWAEHSRRLEAYRGRRLIGLETGLRPLDERTLGLRGVTILGAKPNVGKTALAVQLALGVCRNHEANDAVVVVVSLDMSRWELYRRVHCHLADLDWVTLMFGSQGHCDQADGDVFSPGHRRCLENADRLLVEYQIDRRLFVHDRESLGPVVDAGRLASLVADAKARAGAGRALLVVDYLQLLDVPEDIAERGDELEAAKHRVRALQAVVRSDPGDAGPGGEGGPGGDAVLAISEARKPADSKTAWGNDLADLIGSVRTAYAADAILLYRRMSEQDVAMFYGLGGSGNKERVSRKLEQLEDQGVSPVVLNLAKARDGMNRGEIGLEFEFRRSRFRTIEAPAVDGPRAGTADGEARRGRGSPPNRGER